MLKNCLNNSNSNISISFLSSEYTYSSNLLENYENNLFEDQFLNFGEGPNINIIVGYIPQNKLEPLLKQRFIYPYNLTNLDWIKLLKKIKKVKNFQSIKLHESSSSSFDFAETIAWRIFKEIQDIKIDIVSYRKNNINQFSLINQKNLLNN